MIITRKLKLMMTIASFILLVSCAHNKEDFDIVIPKKDKTVDNFNPTTSRLAIKDGGVVKKITREDNQYTPNIIKENAPIEDDSYNPTDPTVLKQKVKEKIVTANSGSSSNNVNISDSKEEVEVSVEPGNKDIKEDPEIPKDNSPEINQTPIEKDLPNKDEITVLCKDAWFDESMPCDYIPDNLKPTDELGRSVPHFFTSQEAWNWGEQQIEDENSEYGCRGFSRMDGYQNDGKQFFFAYLKVCDIN